MFGRRQELAQRLNKQQHRRVLTTEEAEEEAIQRELADLPDDEGMEGGGLQEEPGLNISDLRRHPRHQEPSDEEDEEEGQNGVLHHPEPAQDLRRRPARYNEEEEEMGNKDEVAILQQQLEQHEKAEQHLKRRPGRHEVDIGRGAEAQQQQQQQQQNMARRPAHEDGATGGQPEQKRARVQEQEEAGPRVRFQDTAQQSTATQAEANAQVTMALTKLIVHLGNPTKFPKAASLLRQLLEGESLTKEHRPLTFEALRAAFPIQAERSKHLVEPTLRRDVIKLLASAQGRVQSGYFNKAERLQVTEVFHLIGGVRHEMQTDDSFIFSKVLASLRKEIGNLPEVMDKEDDAAYERVMTDRIMADQAGHSQPSQQQQQQQPVLKPSHPAAAQQSAQSADDPFGLDMLIRGDPEQQQADDDDPFSLNTFFEPKKTMAQAEPPKPKPKELPSKAYDHAELLAARRRALLDCVYHARTFHKLAWAQTAIELTAEHCWQNKSRFCGQMHDEVDELWRWVKSARALRKRGPSAKEINRDSTSFER